MQFRTRPSLIVRLRNLNDADAWREFAASYQPFIQHVGKKAGVPRDRLGDVAQDVLLTVVRAIPRFLYDPRRGRFRSWLARIVRSRCIDLARRRSRETAAHHRAARPELEQPAGAEADGLPPLAETLRAALRSVQASSRPKTWICFERHVLEERPAIEVAIELGISVNSVYVNSARLVDRVERECRRALKQERSDEWRAMPAEF